MKKVFIVLTILSLASFLIAPLITKAQTFEAPATPPIWGGDARSSAPDQTTSNNGVTQEQAEEACKDKKMAGPFLMPNNDKGKEIAQQINQRAGIFWGSTTIFGTQTGVFATSVKDNELYIANYSQTGGLASEMTTDKVNENLKLALEGRINQGVIGSNSLSDQCLQEIINYGQTIGNLTDTVSSVSSIQVCGETTTTIINYMRDNDQDKILRAAFMEQYYAYAYKTKKQEYTDCLAQAIGQSSGDDSSGEEQNMEQNSGEKSWLTNFIDVPEESTSILDDIFSKIIKKLSEWINGATVRMLNFSFSIMQNVRI